MPDLPVSEAQLDALESVRDDLEAAYVGEYGTVPMADAVQYLLDTYTPPSETDGSTPDIEGLTTIDGVGEATAESLAAAGFETVADVAAAAPGDLTEIRGIGDEQAVSIAAAAATQRGDAADGSESGPGSDAGGHSDGDGREDEDAGASPENTLKQAMSLLDAHDERWREASGDEPYEVDLPDGSTEPARTKDDVKRLLFKHWR
ncbi:helix-hairpin-helix domain-containing protein [Natronomonas sp.]|uniref:helix-hairpin-helix domain-containing protein n=1 Tax=Natronomonas sp. TaxID=2184060 RepID=UPI00261170CA|nr:helix-hairpin-helix domain-containing protein [Natronomonas sp.]